MHSTEIGRELLKAAQDMNYNGVKEILNIIEPTQRTVVNYWTALREASGNGSYNIVIIILKSIPPERVHQMMYLQCAEASAGSGHLDILKLYHKLGADLRANYEYILYGARNHPNTVRFLIMEVNADYKTMKANHDYYSTKGVKFPPSFHEITNEKDAIIKKYISELPENPPN
jgi:hypothetical protein